MNKFINECLLFEDLRGKVVMITGATRGLGKALALAFGKLGAHLAVCARNIEGLNELRTEIEDLAAKPQLLTVQADASKAQDIERFVSLTEEHFGRIDVLINNASIVGPSPIPYLLDYPAEDFIEVFHVNTLGPFLMTRRVLPGMLSKQSGVIINVTSEAGVTGFPGWGAYGISKFALEGLSQTWAAELEESGVRFHMVDPGEMDTEMHALAVPDCDYELAEPEDVVPVFLYLASDASEKHQHVRLQAQEFKLEEYVEEK